MVMFVQPKFKIGTSISSMSPCLFRVLHLEGLPLLLQAEPPETHPSIKIPSRYLL